MSRRKQCGFVHKEPTLRRHKHPCCVLDEGHASPHQALAAYHLEGVPWINLFNWPIETRGNVREYVTIKKKEETT